MDVTVNILQCLGMTRIGPTPVIILTGFLGSGKTTLLNALLARPAFADTAVVVNELGEIGLDDLLVEAVEENVVLLSSGCLCCGLMGSLRETLLDLHARRVQGTATFSRVIVETTGLADPGPIVQSLLRDPMVVGDFVFDRVVTVVDALLGDGELDRHVEARRQAALADRLILSKIDVAEPEAVARLRERIRRLNPVAAMVDGRGAWSTPEDVLGGEDDPMLERAVDAHVRDHDHDHGEHESDVRADSFFIEGPIEWAGLAGWIELVREFFGDRLLRCKGLIEVRGVAGPVLVQGVQTVFAPPQALDSWPGPDRRSRLVCISRDLDEALLRASLPTLSIPAGEHRPGTIAEMLAAAH